MLGVEELELKGAKIITPQVFTDERGFFIQTHQERKYKQIGIDLSFVQDNHSYSKHKTLRGMHFQNEPEQAKLVFVVVGKIYDVIVDLRRQSPTFGKWVGVYLNDREKNQLFVPSGFAHGFCVVSSEAHVFYKVSAPYQPEKEKTFRFDDPDVGIVWPFKEFVVSPRDEAAPSFQEVAF